MVRQVWCECRTHWIEETIFRRSLTGNNAYWHIELKQCDFSRTFRFFVLRCCCFILIQLNLNLHLGFWVNFKGKQWFVEKQLVFFTLHWLFCRLLFSFLQFWTMRIKKRTVQSFSVATCVIYSRFFVNSPSILLHTRRSRHHHHHYQAYCRHLPGAR